MKCIVFNARSVCNKLLELHYLLYGHDYDVILTTETWLNAKVPNSILDPDSQYNVVRYDRPRDTTGGGVCAFVRKSLHVVEVDVNAFYPSLEICGFDLHFCNTSFRFINVYRPDYESAVNLVECLSKFVNVKSQCIITGDQWRTVH